MSLEPEDAPLLLQASHSLTFQFASPAKMSGLMFFYPFEENLEIKGAVFGNVGTLISFRVSGDDADTLQTEFATKKPVHLLQDLPDYHLYVKSLIKHKGISRPHEPKLVKATRPLEFPSRNVERIIRASHQRFARPRAEVEAKLTKFLAG